MKLHENQPLFAQPPNFAANILNMRPEFIEKDLLDYSCVTENVSKCQCRESSFQRRNVPL